MLVVYSVVVRVVPMVSLEWMWVVDLVASLAVGKVGMKVDSTAVHWVD